MHLTRKLLVMYAGILVGLVVGFVVLEVAGLGTDLRIAAVILLALVVGTTYGTVRRHRASLVR